MIEIKTDDFEIKVTVDDVTVAELSSMNGIEGYVTEPDIPFRRMPATAMLEIAKFFINAAKERMEGELSLAEQPLPSSPESK